MYPSNEADKMMISPYTSAMRSLMSDMIDTRPDIAQAVGVVSKYMTNHGREHWKTVKRILNSEIHQSNLEFCIML